MSQISQDPLTTFQPLCTFTPWFDSDLKLWFYGNQRLLKGKRACLPQCFGKGKLTESELRELENQTLDLILSGHIIVCGIHNEAHRRVAMCPLRWGSPRIVVVSGGFYHHFGPKIDHEPFYAAQRWRYEFDPYSDLIVSRRALNDKPTCSMSNATVDRLISQLKS
ncbi:MAG: hypothetical protein JST12_18585 [Armatimonadetes bacterium]|nr:hypothetical protein [Armatimonadota bacterium]